MKKSLLAIAMLGILSAGTASAQSSALAIYGIVDAGVNYERGNVAGSDVKLTSGIQSGSRLGFRGTEDLGGGLSAKFVLETGIAIDTGGFNQGGLAFGRQSWVGLNGDFGTVAMGRQYTPHYTALNDIDPFKTGLSGNSQNMILSPTRMDNTIKYSSPSWSGFIAELAYGLGEVIGNNTASRQLGGALGYANGPALVKLAYHGADDATGTDRTKSTLLGGVWDFGVATANIAINRTRGTGIVDSRDYLIGSSVPFGPSTLLVSYIRKDDRSTLNRDGRQWALGYTYAVSKRTNFYTSFGRITGDNGFTNTVGTAVTAGTGDEAFNVGIRHVF